MINYLLAVSTIFTKKKEDGSIEIQQQKEDLPYIFLSVVNKNDLFGHACELLNVSAHPEILSAKNEAIEIQLGVLVDVVADKYSTFDVKCECGVVVTELESKKQIFEFYSSGYKESVNHQN
jgi:hypothetical protein